MNGQNENQRRRETEDAGIRERLLRFKLATQLNGQRQDMEWHGEKIYNVKLLCVHK